jgi:hypothetical protein
MKAKMFMVLVIIALLIPLAMPAPAHAESTRIYFTGTEVCDWDSFNFARLWNSGPNTHIDGIKQTCYPTASIPQFTGTSYLSDGRIVWNSLELSPISGKIRMVSGEGGVWTGSWILPANSNTIRVTGHGEGLYKGLQIFIFEDDPTGAFWGYIMDTGG